MSYNIQIAEEANPEIISAFKKLLPQLGDLRIPSNTEITEIIEAPQSILFLAVNDVTIVGMLTMSLSILPSGKKAWIEDVVVDSSYRQQGIGHKLIETALKKAKELHLTSVNLTSRPARIAANLLYQKIGFKQRDTNVYTY